MVQDIIWKADRHSAYQKNILPSFILWGGEGPQFQDALREIYERYTKFKLQYRHCH
jgi:hypothetical protein